MKFGFYSCMSGVNWGGSEVLWSLVAQQLLEQGHEVCINFKWWPKLAEPLAVLQQQGARLWLRDQPPRSNAHERLLNWYRWFAPKDGTDQSWLERERPDQVLVTLGYHPDQVALADECQRLGIPYAVNVQCASSAVFIHHNKVESYQRAYANAARVYVVSEENLEKLETNLAMRLRNAELICNPYNVPRDAPPTWPSDDSYRLACVGRIHFASKGQDLLVQVLRHEKWRDRDLKIVFYGRNQGNEQQLRELIRLNRLEDKFEFAGYESDVTKIWEQHHGLVLPSRYEGAALVVTEAMMCHRLVVCTDTGRNRELIDEGQSGFVAEAPTARLLDDALEKAWQARARWREMGEHAGRSIRERFSADPVGDLTQALLRLRTARQAEPQGCSPQSVPDLVRQS